MDSGGFAPEVLVTNRLGGIVTLRVLLVHNEGGSSAAVSKFSALKLRPASQNGPRIAYTGLT